MKGWWLALGVTIGMALLLAWIRRRQDSMDQPTLCDQFRDVWKQPNDRRKVV